MTEGRATEATKAPGGAGPGRVDPSSPVPKHAQLRDILLDHIADDLAVGAAIPSERELAERFALSRMTVRQAVDALVAEGWLRRVPGRGTFVARPTIVMPLRLTSFTDDMRARGLRPGAVDLGHRVVPATDAVADALDLAPRTPVCLVDRLRTADGAPMAVERAHLPDPLVPGLADRPLADRSLYAVLAETYGLVLDAGEQTIEAGIAGEPDVRLLGLRTGDPVLLVQRRSLAQGHPVEYAVSTYRGDRYRLRVALDVPPDHRDIPRDLSDARTTARSDQTPGDLG
ncbi:MAG: GntR family transcriptional regulator [Actinomycetes bacterium]